MRMTEEEFERFLIRTGRSPAEFGLPEKKKKKPKYKNQKVYVFSNGAISYRKTDSKIYGKIIDVFDSTKEYQRWNELQLLQKANAISELNRQQTFEIQPAFEKDGKKHQAITYKADFTYIRNGQKIVEDVKGFDIKTRRYITTKDFNLKWKLLQAKYPDLVFEIY